MSISICSNDQKEYCCSEILASLSSRDATCMKCPWMERQWSFQEKRLHFENTGTLQINNYPPHPHFQRAALTLKGLYKLCARKTQSQIQRKTVEVYKLLFLIIKSTGGGILASFVGPLPTPNRSETITTHGSWSIVWKNLIY